MPTAEQNLKKLETLIQLLSEGISRNDFVKAFENVVTLVLKIEKRWSEEHRGKIETLTNLHKDLTGKEFAALKKELMGAVTDALKRLKERMMQIQDGSDGEDGTPGKDGEPGKDGSPDTPQEIMQKIKSVPLKIEDVYKLQEELDMLKKLVKSGGTRIMAVGGGHIVKAHDLSGSLSSDGSVRTFSLPAFWRIISVNLSSFPNILRPTVDFTEDSSAMTITFTSEIPSASISSPQTCVVLYSE